jgi:hypothetical protein
MKVAASALLIAALAVVALAEGLDWWERRLRA